MAAEQLEALGCRAWWRRRGPELALPRGEDAGAAPHGLSDSLSLAKARFLLVPVCSPTTGLSELMNQSASHSACCEGPH